MWIQVTGEICVPLQAAGFVFTPTEEEKRERRLHVSYSSTKDRYCRLSSSAELTPSWDGCVWRTESVFRKVEHDWQMVGSLCCDSKPGFTFKVHFHQTY